MTRELNVRITLSQYNGSRYATTDNISDEEFEDLIQRALWEDVPYDSVNVSVETVSSAKPLCKTKNPESEKK